ncbi:hypothetical protein LFML04_0594 [Leptospirillum ferriphilum ML-04]|uniref:Uncharacterized protein n=1 Tax=Leptospirillum ferriphilum (strain ML-04) TaxID=1048260 RepID=J9Z8P6_LEPFM|nr:hypothetical protein LFML04_0594 [Leptospirillum ferriphilum ML-04]
MRLDRFIRKNFETMCNTYKSMLIKILLQFGDVDHNLLLTLFIYIKFTTTG